MSLYVDWVGMEGIHFKESLTLFSLKISTSSVPHFIHEAFLTLAAIESSDFCMYV
jgi:hypothetical protein